MSRTLWFVAGAATSTYAMVKARRAAEAFTPEGIRDRLAGLSLGLHVFTDEVRTEAAAKEADLRERLGLGPEGTPALERGPVPDGTPATRDHPQPHPQPGATTERHLQLTREGNT